jgi:hypothetical protein
MERFSIQLRYKYLSKDKVASKDQLTLNLKDVIDINEYFDCEEKILDEWGEDDLNKALLLYAALKVKEAEIKTQKLDSSIPKHLKITKYNILPAERTLENCGRSDTKQRSHIAKINGVSPIENQAIDFGFTELIYTTSFKDKDRIIICLN